MTRSGAIGRIPDDELIGFRKEDMPWHGLERVADHPFVNCAEAKAYLEIIARNGNPKHYRITTFTPEGEVNAPCKNCSQWVYETFGEVVDN